MCTRTVSAIAHVLESHGLATIALSLVRGQAERGAVAGQDTAAVIGGLYLAPFAQPESPTVTTS